MTDIVEPFNVEVEQALIAAILNDNRAYSRVSGELLPKHFYEPVLGRIYEACGKLIDKGEYASAQRLAKHFDADPALEQMGGGRYLVDLQDSVVTIVAAADYAKDIKRLWQKRQLIRLGLSIVESAQTDEVGESVDQDIVAAEEQLFEIAGESRSAAPVKASDAAWETLQEIDAAVKAKRAGQVVGLPTGLAPLDERIGGLHKSLLYVVAGGTSQGKSALAGGIAETVAAAGNTVLFVSLEMPRSQVMRRAYSRLTGITVTAMDRATLSRQEQIALADAGMQIGRWPMSVLDKGDLSLSELRSHARRMRMAGPLGLIVVDYLQLLQPPTATRYEGRVQEVAKISRGLKALAMDLECPVVALSQLSREVDKRDDKRPKLSDLRESGTIEQDADVVLFVFREEKYLRDAKPGHSADEAERANHTSTFERVRGTAEIIVAKQRNGAIGDCLVGFDGRRMMFTSERHLEPASAQDIAQQQMLEGL